MKVSDLPQPGKYGGSAHLRQMAVKAFHTLSAIRSRGAWPNDANTLKAFFEACATKCEEFIQGDTPVITVTLSPSSIEEGATSQASVSWSNDPALTHEVVWSSSKPDNATVDSRGVITGVAAGNSVITATPVEVGVAAKTKTITVTAPAG